MTRNNKRLTTEEFIRRAKKVHGDKYDYSDVDYINSAMYLQSDASIALLVSWLATSILKHSSAISSMSSISKLNFIMFLHFCAYSVHSE